MDIYTFTEHSGPYNVENVCMELKIIQESTVIREGEEKFSLKKT